MHVFGLTSRVLLFLSIAVAVLAPLLLVWLYFRRRQSLPTRAGLVLPAVVLVVTIVAQIAAVSAVFIAVNRQFAFYSSWSDLLGQRSGAPSAITVNGSQQRGKGRLEVLRVDGRVSHTHAEMLAWLPPQYDQPAYRHHRFPVVMFLPGQPEQPAGIFRGFELASAARTAITADHVAPFVIVVPPLMIRPPIDTECTNVPKGPQALSWLSTDVPRAVTSQLRVDRPGPHWSVMGWSTGGFCAAKLLYTYPREFAAAVGMGGYYQPDTNNVWPHLFGGSIKVRHENSPEWLYYRKSAGLTGRLMIIASREDGESWASSAKMLVATRDNPNVSHVVLPRGGHNFALYRRYVGTSLQWLKRVGVLA